MPKLVRTDDPSVELVSNNPAEVDAALKSGEWRQVGDTGFQQVNTITGGTEAMDLGRALSEESRFAPASGAALTEEAVQSANAQQFDTPGQNALTFAEGVGSGLSAGGSDFLLKALGADTAERAAQSPGLRAIGQGVGMVAGGIAGAAGAVGTLGKALALTPTGLASGAAAGVTAKLGGGIAAQAAGAALEGTLTTAGVAAGDIALRDPEFTAEAFLEEVGPAALLGGVVSGVAGAAIGGIAKGATAVRKAHDVSPLVNMNSPAGRAMAKHVAKSHGEIDALGASIEARAAAKGRAALDANLHADGDVINEAVGMNKSNADQLFARAEKHSVLESEVLDRIDVEGTPAPVNAKRWNQGIQEEHNAIEDTIFGAGREKEFAADIKSLRKAKATIGKVANTADPSDPALAALAKYEALVKSVGNKLGRDSDSAIRGILSEADMAPTTRGVYINTPTPKPVTEALTQARLARKVLDDVGGLTPDTAKEFMAAYRQFAGATDNLAVTLGGKGMLAQSADAIEGMLTKQAARIAEVSESGARAASLKSLRKAAHEAFGAGKVITSDDVARVLRQPKEQMLASMSKLDDYYKGIKAAARDADDLRVMGNLEEKMSAYSKELAEQAGIEGGTFTPEMMAAALGIASTALPSFEGPTDELLKVGVLISMLSRGGRRGVAQGRSFVQKMARAMFVRGGAGIAAQQVGKLGLEGGTRAMAQGAAAAAGYNVFGQLADNVRGILRASDGASSTIKGVADSIATGAKRARRVTPTFGALAAKLSMDGVEEKDERKAFAKVADTLARYAVNPMQANAQMYEKLKPLQGVSPVLADEAEVKAAATFQYLYDWMPKDPGTMMFLGKSMWQPTDRELYEFGARMLGALAPTAAIDGIADGVIPPQAADALRETNPSMFAQFQQAVMEYAEKLTDADYPKLVSLGIAAGVPLHPTTEGRYVSWIQSVRQTATGEQQAAMSTPPSGAVTDPTADENYTAAQKMMNA